MSQYSHIVKLLQGDTLPMPLLLLADEAIEAVERYIYQCDVYVLVQDDDDPIGVFALYRNSEEAIELKNLAVAEPFQNKGLGSYLLDEIYWIAVRGGYKNIIVGTATVGRQLDFYKKNGFSPIGIRKNYFLENYPEPIFEDGRQLVDMILLERKIG